MEIEEESVRLSRAFGPQVWAQTLAEIIVRTETLTAKTS
jgi:hypothetical protein